MKVNVVVFSCLTATGIALFSGSLSRVLYFYNYQQTNRGFSIEVSKSNEPANNNFSSTGAQIDLGILLSSANLENGKKIFTRCSLCHTIEKNGAHKVGPNLWNVINSYSATKGGYTYSNAMQNKKITWNWENIAKLISKPSRFVPGTKMSFAGIKDPKELADLLLFVSTLSDSKPTLPEKTLKISLDF